MAAHQKVYGDYPVYYKNPIRWARYHAHTKPHFVFAVFFAVSAPVLLLLTPLRRKFLYDDHTPLPYVYPLPNRPRDKNLSGYDD
ncbi:uncharacterized protein SPAPADRAFT_58726 [Spathaspora passalidarum NRRL Y-27907]|uniref:NADH-ubiquinone oxidoreductase 9.5 kDa subunit n=1 Tax=Spathaspora passalidarum (strain NRRL Y-27907 / 11-Y1) TaxID=619300 RepID=G3AH51_SPAPN|nr:uncharacterized protein SPAPADRAFT_58726 [Spathaspora passalidarum NRRL Y-27907]EGW35482.1 hypothetical protein SPAPADRAFT_58726 [Spathaspora passalidarum NRRL Y-27907]